LAIHVKQAHYGSDYRVENLGNHNPRTLELPAWLTTLEVLRQTEDFMPAPAYLLQQSSTCSGITGRSMPVEGTLRVDYALVAHKRTANPPLHNWLWDQITCTIAELRTPLQRKTRQRMTAGSADPLQ
jgi:hypothetical protein